MTLTKKEIKEGLKTEQFHREAAKQCGPVIEKIAATYYPDLAPEELGQLLLKDYAVGNIFTGYEMQRTNWDEIWDEIDKEK